MIHYNVKIQFSTNGDPVIYWVPIPGEGVKIGYATLWEAHVKNLLNIYTIRISTNYENIMLRCPLHCY
jgi:hypothetical protein